MNKLLRLCPIVVAGALGGCHQPPTESTLIRNFQSHRLTFDKLLGMAAEDPEYRRISGGRVPPIGMTTKRFSQYSELFRQLRIESGLNRYATYQGAVFLLADTDVPIGGKGRSEGYVNSPVPLTPLVPNLYVPELPFEIHHGTGHRIAFRHLDGAWYLFADADW